MLSHIMKQVRVKPQKSEENGLSFSLGVGKNRKNITRLHGINNLHCVIQISSQNHGKKKI